MNCAWKSLKNRLYDKRDCKGQTPLKELISNVPSGVPAESWERLVRYRRRSAWKVSTIENEEVSNSDRSMCIY